MKRIVKDLKKLNDRVDEAILENEEQLNLDTQSIKEVLYKHKELFALSAPQVGIKSRIFCIKFANGDIRTFINPMIIKSSGMHLSRETNASIPDKEFILVRGDEIQATYQTPVGKVETNLFQGIVSEVFQQMTQLLDGIMISDIGLEVLEGWDEATQEERDQVIDMYLDSLKLKSDELRKEIDESPDLKEIDNAINFMTSVAEGKTKLERIKTAEEKQQEKVLMNILKSNTRKENYKEFVNKVTKK